MIALIPCVVISLKCIFFPLLYYLEFASLIHEFFPAIIHIITYFTDAEFVPSFEFLIRNIRLQAANNLVAKKNKIRFSHTLHVALTIYKGLLQDL